VPYSEVSGEGYPKTVLLKAADCDGNKFFLYLFRNGDEIIVCGASEEMDNDSIHHYKDGDYRVSFKLPRLFKALAKLL
jgi:hypothetical protein